MEFTNNIKEAEELDKLKSKVLKFVLYKKRTEAEVWEKFQEEDQNKLEEVIEILSLCGCGWHDTHSKFHWS